VSLVRKLSIIALVYVIEGFPMGMYAHVWPVFFRRHDVSLTEIGWLSGLYVAWSAKVLWSPLIDRFGERRQWIAGSMVVMAACLVAIAGAGGGQIGLLLWLMLALYCVASATQDIAIDAYTIGLVDRGQEGPANSMRVMAYRAGLLAAGTGLLFLPRWIGWSGTFVTAAVLSAAMAASVFATPRVPVPAESRSQTMAPLRRWLGRGGAVAVLGFVFLYRVGDRAMGPMVLPFWVDRGFSDEEIATISGALGIAAMVVGAIFGGGVVARIGIGRSLWVLGALALASNLGYAAAAAFPESGRTGVYAASLVESFCAGLVTAAFLSYLMRICEKEHAAVQYALLTAIYALSGSLVALPSGWLTERIDYAAYFALTAALALPAFALLPFARSWIGAEGREEREPSSTRENGDVP
jgi:PAT family beta-lactamase induction signal transducer AmpG